MAKKAKKEKKAGKGKKAKKTTKKTAAKNSAKRAAANRTPAKKAPARKAKTAKSPAPKPAARNAIAKAPAKKPAAVAAPPVPAVPPAPKAVAPPPKPVVTPPRPAAPAPAPRATPTEPTTAATKPTAKHTASPFGLPKVQIAKFDLPKMEVPAFHELADKGFAEAKENYERIQQTGNEMTAILEETYSTAAKGIADYNLKLFEIARAHTSAVFDFARKLVTSKSLSEVIEFSSAHVRHQFDRVSAQNKELLTLAQKVAIETAEAAQWVDRLNPLGPVSLVEASNRTERLRRRSLRFGTL
jgi:phasin